MRTNTVIPAFLTLGAVACSSQPEKAKTPNVIVILADDVGYGDLDWNGSETVRTPHVARMAAEGLRLTNAHTVAATSTPARYGLLTGQYPWRREGTGIAAGNAGMVIRPEQYTMADMFRSAGYATGAVGKWHLGLGDTTGSQDWNGRIAPGLEDIGFDYSYIMAATGDRVPCVYIENQRVVGLDPADPIEVSYTAPFPGEPTGKDNPELLRIRPSMGHDQSIVDGISRIGYMKGGMAARWHDEEIADRITDKACEFIERNSSGPFFLYFGTNDIHVPRVPHERFAGRSGMGPRGDAILSLDYSVGRILSVLDSLGIADNTLVILSSDNGPIVDDGYEDRAEELLGDHKPWGPFLGTKYSIYEAGTRVPMVVRWKGRIVPGSSDDALFSQIDLFASLASLCGGTVGPGAAPDSRDCLSVLLGEGGGGRSSAVVMNLQENLAIISDGWKYVAPSDDPYTDSWSGYLYGNRPEARLFDLRNDPAEQHDVTARHPEIAERLRRELEAVKAEGGVWRERKSVPEK